jgi:hypothetical protein
MPRKSPSESPNPPTKQRRAYAMYAATAPTLATSLSAVPRTWWRPEAGTNRGESDPHAPRNNASLHDCLGRNRTNRRRNQ